MTSDVLARQWGQKEKSVFGVSGITREGLESAIGCVIRRAKEHKQLQLEQIAAGDSGGRSR